MSSQPEIRQVRAYEWFAVKPNLFAVAGPTRGVVRVLYSERGGTATYRDTKPGYMISRHATEAQNEETKRCCRMGSCLDLGPARDGVRTPSSSRTGRTDSLTKKSDPLSILLCQKRLSTADNKRDATRYSGLPPAAATQKLRMVAFCGMCHEVITYLLRERSFSGCHARNHQEVWI